MIDRKDILYLSRLSKIGIDGDEIDRILGDISDLLDYMSILDELDTEDVKPTYYVTENIQRLREDVVDKSLDKEEVFKNAPEEGYGFFKLPRVMD